MGLVTEVQELPHGVDVGVTTLAMARISGPLIVLGL